MCKQAWLLQWLSLAVAGARICALYIYVRLFKSMDHASTLEKTNFGLPATVSANQRPIEPEPLSLAWTPLIGSHGHRTTIAYSVPLHACLRVLRFRAHHSRIPTI